MADGALVLDLDEMTAARLAEAAAAAGETPANFAQHVLADALDPGRWSISLERLAEYDRTGAARPAKEVLAEFQARVEKRLAERA